MQTLAHLRAGDYAGVKSLRLSCGLTEFPPEIFDLAEMLEVLDLSGNALTALPDDLHRLGRLRILFCSNNRFTALPAALGRCANLSMVGFKSNRIDMVTAEALPASLRWLILTDNCVAELPQSIGKCDRLQKLMLAGNRLTRLPDSLAQCRHLELLRIAANDMTALPDWLGDMPRLAWLAFAGNAFSSVEARQAAGNDIGWDVLELHEILGEGASGTIFRATDRRTGQAVAVKQFKGAMTSDGLPHSEMTACLAAQPHPNVIPVLGRVADHPDGRDALVMEMIADSFVNLAGPPSMDSCTRDIYPDDSRFDLTQVMGIATAMASVGAHLHARGLMHGDLYAHNILHDGRGGVLTGDFGAASTYDAAAWPSLERIEVRAFGCLLEELMTRCTDALPPELGQIRDACLLETVSARPLFADIVERLG